MSSRSRSRPFDRHQPRRGHLWLVPRARSAPLAPASALRASRRAAVHRRASGERAVVQGDPPRARSPDRVVEAASGLREPHFMHVLQEHGAIPDIVQRALERPTLQELFMELLRAQGVELEALYVGERPTTLFFLAEALLEYEQQFGLWRFKHVQLVERVLGPLTGGTGGTLGAKYLARTIDQKFFPALWAVRAKFYGASA